MSVGGQRQTNLRNRMKTDIRASVAAVLCCVVLTCIVLQLPGDVTNCVAATCLTAYFTSHLKLGCFRSQRYQSLITKKLFFF